MDVPQRRPVWKLSERPDPCLRCGRPAWWNGTRECSVVVATAIGAEFFTVQVRRRACCSARRACSAGSWTVYPAETYPHRTFQLDVVVAAVSEAATTGRVSATAARYMCSPRSVTRWATWCRGISAPEVLTRECARLDVDGCPPSRPDSGEKAVETIVLFEQLARQLAMAGVALPVGRSGLFRVLRHQYDRFRDVSWLVPAASPPMSGCNGGTLP